MHLSTHSTSSHRSALRGMTLIELLIAVFILIVAFVGLFNLFRVSALYVESAQQREGALSLAVERMEQLRALPYSAVGTVDGIPSGTIPQNETLTLNGTSYTRRTLIEYVNDPADDTGSPDYKVAKVVVSWLGPSGTSSETLISNFQGTESTAGTGELSLSAINAAGVPVADAAVTIVNPSTTSPVNLTTYTNTSGIVLFPGTPAASGYAISVTKPGYSTAQTYTATGANPNPNPGNLTIVSGQTTSASFAIDTLASLLVETWTPIVPATTTALLNNSNAIASFSNTDISGNALTLSLADQNGNYVASGSAYSTSTAPAYLAAWSSLSWQSSLPSQTALALHLYQDNGGVYTLIPDSVLPGNSTGFTTSPISLTGVSTSTYPSLVIGANLSTSFSSSTPQVQSWSLGYRQGPTPLPNASFTIQGTKTIGTTGGNAPIYKVLESLTTGATGQYATSTLEWDSYTLTAPAAAGYDISSYCPFEPLAVAPGSSITTSLYLLPHTQNSLLVSVDDATTGNPIDGATVMLSGGTSSTQISDDCGNAFFSGLSSGTYNLSASAAGYSTTTLSNVDVAGQSSASMSL